MTTVPTSLDPVHAVLWERPYAPWNLIPLAAYLCTQDYPDEGRHRIVDAVAAGVTLGELAADGSIEPEHVGAAAAAIEEGRTDGWMGRYRDRGHRLPPICGGCDDDDDRSIPADAVLVPPAFGVLLEVLDELIAFDPDPDGPPDPDDTGEYPPPQAEAPEVDDRTPDRAWIDPRRTDAETAEFGPPMPPISGGSGDDAVWCEEPTDEEWEALYRQSRELPPSGGLD